MSDGPPDAGQALVLERRRLIAAATTGIAVGMAGAPRHASAQPVSPAGAGAPRDLSIIDAAVPVGGLLQSANFGLVGVFDIDWLLEPRYTRLLDNFAASPGAFTSVRFFGALNSGDRENTIPSRSGGVWLRREDKPDFAVTLNALDALVSRGIVPFVTLSFFPPAVSDFPVTPPAGFFRLGGACAGFSARLRIKIRCFRSRALAAGGLERAKFSTLLAQRFRPVSGAVPGDQRSRFPHWLYRPSRRPDPCLYA